MKAMNMRVGFLPFGVQGSVKDNPVVRQSSSPSSRRAAVKAEAARVVIGIETPLDADGHKRFLDDVGSPAVQVYYNLGDALESGYNIDNEIRVGERPDCQIHCKEGDVWLGDGAIDFPRVKRAARCDRLGGVARRRTLGAGKEREGELLGERTLSEVGVPGGLTAGGRADPGPSPRLRAPPPGNRTTRRSTPDPGIVSDPPPGQ